MNVDATINNDTRVMGISAIILKSRGEVKVDLSNKMIGFYPLKVAEDKALVLSLAWAVRNISLNLHFVESNAVIVVQVLKNGFFWSF